MTIQQMIDRLKTLDVTKIAYDVLSRHEDDLILVQLEQFAAGLNLAGKQMSPTILDDPYFVEQAEIRNRVRKRIAKKSKKPLDEVTPLELATKWINKKNQQQSSIFAERRPEYVPNLIYSSGEIIWNEVRVFANGTNNLRIGTEFGIQMELEEKYGDLFGLNPQGVAYVIREFFYDEFFIEIRKHLLGQ
jgi:uncharacterized membrane protein